MGAAAPTARGEAVVRVRSLAKQFRREDRTIVPAIDDVSLDVRPGEFVVLLGPSGCGKTTLLRSIAGLERPDSGQVEIHGRPVFDSAVGLNQPPEDRRISMIFQSYALWPHMAAFDNVAYPLRSRRVPAGEIEGRVREALRMVGIPELTGQFPGQMSGGQQQRVALARAIVSRDDLILFDEPLSNVDAKVREQLRIELLQMQQALRFAAVYVTHDQTEAMALAHRVAVMRAGRIVQIGPPREIYERPVSRYVANFVGTSNELPGRISGDKATTPLGELAATAAPGVKDGDEVTVVFRPERCMLSPGEPTGPNRWQGVVETALFLGAHSEHVVRVGERRFQVWGVGGELMERDAAVWLSVAPEHLLALPSGEGR